LSVSNRNAQTDDWTYLFSELWRRTREPISHVPFVMYFAVGIVAYGALGIWIELIKLGRETAGADLSGLITALLTFFPALIGSTCIQFVLVLAGRDRPDKSLIATALFAQTLSVAVAVLLAVFSSVHPGLVLVLGILSSLAAVWVWWIVTCDDSTFRKQPSIDAAIGGDLAKPLAGDTKEFKT
jgi:hypothetical protein